MEIVYTKQTSGFEAGKHYRNPAYFQGIDKFATSVTVIGDYPEIVKAYQSTGIPVNGKTANDIADLTTAQLKEALTAKGMEFSDNAKKADLVKLLEEAGGA